MATPPWVKRTSPVRHGGDEFYGYLGLVAGGVFAQGVVAFDGDDAHGDAGVGADDASVVVQGAVSKQRQVVFHVTRSGRS